MKRCSMCSNVGWILDADGAGMTVPLSLELIPCFHPECQVNPLLAEGGYVGEPPVIASLVFKGPRFTNVSRHPVEDYVMSVTT